MIALNVGFISSDNNEDKEMNVRFPAVALADQGCVCYLGHIFTDILSPKHTNLYFFLNLCCIGFHEYI